MEERAWYSVQTYSGMENAVKKNIERRIESMNMQEYIFNVLVPEEVRYEKKKKTVNYFLIFIGKSFLCGCHKKS